MLNTNINQFIPIIVSINSIGIVSLTIVPSLSRPIIESSNSLDNSFKFSVLGIVSPFSQRDTACLVIMILIANSSWDKPLFCGTLK